MKPVSNSKTKKYKGVASGFIYTFERYTPCDAPHNYRLCQECPGKSVMTYSLHEGAIHHSVFCTQGIKKWEIK